MSWFVTFEGLDGSGKSTQVALLADLLRARGRPAFVTREPGGTDLGEHLRSILLPRRAGTTDPGAEALMMCAARAQLVAREIRPRLAEGEPVICDRYGDSTLAYQGYGRGLALEDLRLVVRFATGGLVPNLTVLLDVDVEEASRRKLATASATAGVGGRTDTDFFDAMDRAFRERVRRGYLALAHADPGRWLVLDASQPRHTIHERIGEAVSQLREEGDRLCRT